MSDGSDTVAGALVEPSLDTVFDLFAVRDRRAMLYYLADHGTASLDELVDGVVEGVDSSTNHERRRRLSIALVHAHLPRCVDAGVVTVDTGAETRYGVVPTFTPWVDWVRSRDHPPRVLTGVGPPVWSDDDSR